MTRLARAADRIARGSSLYARRLAAGAAAWCARGRRHDLPGWRGALGVFARLALLVFGVYLLARVVRAVPALMWALTGWWTLASWRAEKPSPTVIEEAGEQPPVHSSDDVRNATLEWVWRLIGDTQGVHLRDLLSHAHAHGLLTEVDLPAFRGHLERWGIPVRKRVRVRGQGVTVGIHRDDLQPPATTSPTQAA